MKKSLSLLVGVLVPSALLMVGACGDDVIDAEEGDDDGSTDARQDVTNIPPRPDSGRDATPDTGRDSSRADADAADPDSGDADTADADAGPLPPDPRIAVFAAELGAAACAIYDGCCAGLVTPQVPETRTTCAAAIATDRRFHASLLDAYFFSPGVALGNKVRLDPVRAADCIAATEGLGCANLGTPAAGYKAMLQACVDALVGVGVAGEPCLSDLECTRDNSCIGATRAGVAGVCTALVPSGQSAAFSAQDNGDSCSYRGYGFGTGLRGQPATADDATLKCLPQQVDNAICVPFSEPEDLAGSDFDCQSGSCSVNDAFEKLICRADVKLDPLYCEQYIIAP